MQDNFIDLTIDPLPHDKASKRRPTKEVKLEIDASLTKNAFEYDSTSCRTAYCPYCRAFDSPSNAPKESLKSKCQRYLALTNEMTMFVICGLNQDQLEALFESYWAEQCFLEAYYCIARGLCCVTLGNPELPCHFWEVVKYTTALPIKVFAWRKSYQNNPQFFDQVMRKFSYTCRANFRRNPILQKFSFEELRKLNWRDYEPPAHEHPFGLLPLKIYGFINLDKPEDIKCGLLQVTLKHNGHYLTGCLPHLDFTPDETLALESESLEWLPEIYDFKPKQGWSVLEQHLNRFKYNAEELYKITSWQTYLIARQDPHNARNILHNTSYGLNMGPSYSLMSSDLTPQLFNQPTFYSPMTTTQFYASMGCNPNQILPQPPQFSPYSLLSNHPNNMMMIPPQIGPFGQFGQFGQVLPSVPSVPSMPFGQVGQVGQAGQAGQVGPSVPGSLFGQLAPFDPTTQSTTQANTNSVRETIPLHLLAIGNERFGQEDEDKEKEQQEQSEQGTSNLMRNLRNLISTGEMKDRVVILQELLKPSDIMEEESKVDNLNDDGTPDLDVDAISGPYKKVKKDFTNVEQLQEDLQKEDSVEVDFTEDVLRKGNSLTQVDHNKSHQVEETLLILENTGHILNTQPLDLQSDEQHDKEDANSPSVDEPKEKDCQLVGNDEEHLPIEKENQNESNDNHGIDPVRQNGEESGEENTYVQNDDFIIQKLPISNERAHDDQGLVEQIHKIQTLN